MLYVFLSFRTCEQTGSFNYLRSDVFTTVKMRIVFFWIITPYILAGYYQRFGVRYRLHLQGRKFVTTYKAARRHSPEDHKSWMEIPYSWTLLWYTLPVSRENLRGEGG
jgi:hypothetical protein